MELWLFTRSYPFGRGETFVGTELVHLCRRFDRVRVFPLFAEGDERPMPSNAELIRLIDDPYRSVGLKDWMGHASDAGALARSLVEDAPNLKEVLVHARDVRSRIGQALYRADRLMTLLDRTPDPDQVLLYSYWTADWATVLGICKRRSPFIRTISRVHGFDLYEDRSPWGWIPFRNFQLEHLDRLFCVSQAGYDHMTACHPAYSDRYALARLGTHDHGPGPWQPSGTLRIVSCSNLVPLKRVDVLVEALGRTSGPVAWTHFGDGPERARIVARTKDMPERVRVDLKGAVDNEEILSWYQHHEVDLFVHLSDSEGGVPVALQEAASFGIPLLACDAGGVREIVGPTTGRLLPAGAGADQVASAIASMGRTPFATPEFRSQVRKVWKENFDADDRYSDLIDQMVHVINYPIPIG